MSREIKFRVWGKTEKEYIRYPFAWLSLFDSPDGLEIEENEDLVIEEFTGLFDRNGKEIYEGDIVKYKLYADSRLEYIDEVFYSTISGAFMVGNEDNIRTLDCLINVEVIGNIHENLELLGGEE